MKKQQIVSTINIRISDVRKIQIRCVLYSKTEMYLVVASSKISVIVCTKTLGIYFRSSKGKEKTRVLGSINYQNGKTKKMNATNLLDTSQVVLVRS